MKRSLFVLCACILQVSICAQEQKLVIDNQTPGWLSSLLTYPQQQNVEELTVTGYINRTDMLFINSLIKDLNLKVLDLSNVVPIDPQNRENYIWRRFLDFGSSKTLQKVRLPLIIRGVADIPGDGSSASIVSNVDSLEIGCEDLSFKFRKLLTRHFTLV